MPRLTRMRALPWLMLFELARVTKSHIDDNLSGHDRRRVADILKSSKGDPRRLTPRERDDLRDIAKRLDLSKLGRDIVPAVVGGRRKKR